MFDWFRNLFRRGDYYRPAKRLLYKYFDGQKFVKSDPMVLYRRLMEKSTDLSGDMQVAASPSKDRFIARDKMMDKIRWIFTLKSYDEGGLTEVEAENLLYHFMDWCESLKKNSNPSLISPKETSAPSKISSEEGQTTMNFLDSGSIEIEYNKEKPTVMQ